MSRRPPVRAARVVDRAGRTAGVARTLARLSPGVATTGLCALALAAGGLHTLLPAEAGASAPAGHRVPTAFTVLAGGHGHHPVTHRRAARAHALHRHGHPHHRAS